MERPDIKSIKEHLKNKRIKWLEVHRDLLTDIIAYIRHLEKKLEEREGE